MSKNEDLTRYRSEFQELCLRMDKLEDSAHQGNADVRIAYEQCRMVLQHSRDTLNHYLTELKTLDNKDHTYLYGSIHDVMQHFEEQLKTTEEKLLHIRSIPPFLY